MRSILGLISLLVVLGVVALIAKSQLHATGQLSAGSPAAAASAVGLTGSDRTFGLTPEMGAGADPTLTEGQRIRQIQQRAAEDTARALQQGTERNDRADPSAR